MGGGTYNAPEHLVPAAEGDRQHGRTFLRIERHPSVLVHSTCRQGRDGAETKAWSSQSYQLEVNLSLKNDSVAQGPQSAPLLT